MRVRYFIIRNLQLNYAIIIINSLLQKIVPPITILLQIAF